MVGSAPNSLVERAAILSNAGFLHGFSTRAGGADFSLLRAPDALALDCTRLAREVGFDPARLYQAKQVHGTTAHIAVGNPSFRDHALAKATQPAAWTPPMSQKMIW